MQKEKLWIIAPIATGVFGGGLIVSLVTGSLITLGRNIPQTDLLADYATGLVLCLTIGISIFVWPVSRKDKFALITIWAVKSAITLGFMLLYEANYPDLDAYYYFDNPRGTSFNWSGFRIENGTQNILNLVWLIYKIMPESYHAVKAIFSLIGLIAIYIFYLAIKIFLQKKDVQLLYLLAFFPSILFWSSILGKEPIVLLGISLYFYGITGWNRKHFFYYLIIMILGAIIVAFVRFWLVLILLAPSAILFVKNARNIFFKSALAIATFGILWLTLQQLQEQFDINSIEDAINILNYWFANVGYGGSSQKSLPEFMNLVQVLKFIPLGMFTALFRPLLGELWNFFGLLAGLENLLLLSLLVTAVTRIRLRHLRDPLVAWTSLLVITWSIIYGFVSYPNLGAAVRFRLQILPILLSLLLYLSQSKKNVYTRRHYSKR